MLTGTKSSLRRKNLDDECAEKGREKHERQRNASDVPEIHEVRTDCGGERLPPALGNGNFDCTFDRKSSVLLSGYERNENKNE